MVTLEILLTIVAPLLLLYLKGRWPQRVTISCLLVIPVLWYLTYAPIHELSHVLGALAMGGTVTQVKLIPSFWRGEFGRAWITPHGLDAWWQQLVTTSAPYVLDLVSVVVGFFALRGRRPAGAFALGVALMLLCLRPTFDVVCETVGLATGARGDPWCLAQDFGYPAVWTSAVGLIVLSVFVSLRVVLRRASVEARARAT